MRGCCSMNRSIKALASIPSVSADELDAGNPWPASPNPTAAARWANQAAKGDDAAARMRSMSCVSWSVGSAAVGSTSRSMVRPIAAMRASRSMGASGSKWGSAPAASTSASTVSASSGISSTHCSAALASATKRSRMSRSYSGWRYVPCVAAFNKSASWSMCPPTALARASNIAMAPA